MNEEEIGYFTRDIIPKFKALVAQRWKEGNPICISTPVEDIILYAELLMRLSTKEK